MGARIACGCGEDFDVRPSCVSIAPPPALPPVAREPQKRSGLQIKPGGFSVGALAASHAGRLEDCYSIEEALLGEGSYGCARRCVCKATGQRCAVKSILKAMVKNAEQFKEEMAIMRLLDHPNIVRLYESFEDARCVYLVLELCEGGELFDRIVADGKFSELLAACTVRQMLRAVNYMHQNQIMHRDLKPENWLLATGDALSRTDLKLIDFGLAKRFTPGDIASTKAGTPYYVAPEVLSGRYGEKSDIWSIGVIMYILLCGSPPFSGVDTVAVLDAVRRGQPQLERPELLTLSWAARGMLRALLTVDPLARPSASEALQHAWLQHGSPPEAGKAGGAMEVQLTATVVQNLRVFAAMNKLKKAALNVIATQLTDETVRELKELFMRMDVDNDGTLSVGELKEGLCRAGLTLPLDLYQMMEQIDTDGSGVIDYTEFMAATIDRRKYAEEDVCWRAFKVFDVDGSGHLDRGELVRLLGLERAVAAGDGTDPRSEETEVDEILAEVDINGDGKIDFDEFLIMMRRTPGVRNRLGTKIWRKAKSNDF